MDQTNIKNHQHMEAMKQTYLHFCSSQLSKENFPHHFTEKNHKHKRLDVQNLQQNRWHNLKQ